MKAILKKGKILRQNKRGFYFIEILIYIQIIGFVFLLISNLGLAFQKKLNFITVDLNEKFRITLAKDLIYRDLLSGVGDVNFWDFENNVFRKKYLIKNFELCEKDICWTILNDKVVRLEGKYDYSKQIWKEKISSFILLNDIKNLKIIPDYVSDKKIIFGVRVIFCLNSAKKKEFYVTLQNKAY